MQSTHKGRKKRLAHTIKNLKLTVLRFRPISEAVITSGGVDVNEISPKTMESKLCRNLYFAGEVIDVDAYTGDSTSKSPFPPDLPQATRNNVYRR